MPEAVTISGEQLDLIISSMLIIGCCLMWALGFVAGDAGAK
jgi:hypothetical protein